MYRLLILTDDGSQCKMLTIGGERESITKDMMQFFDNAQAFEWLHSKNERLAMALFKGITERHLTKQEE